MKNSGHEMQYLKKGHFLLLGVLLANAVIWYAIGFSLIEPVLFWAKVLLYGSGTLAFLGHVYFFRRTHWYFLFYAVSVFLLAVSRLAAGLLPVLTSLLMLPFSGSKVAFQSNGVLLFDRFDGLMGSCCSFWVVQPRYGILEQRLGFVRFDRYPSQVRDYIHLTDGRVYFRYPLEIYENAGAGKDTTEVLPLE